MNLAPDLTTRLEAIKSLLAIGEFELIEMAAQRLEDHRNEPVIAEILDLLRDRRFSEASDQIGTVLAEGARIVRWTDPEIALLKAELDKLAEDVAGVEADKAEIDHLIARFRAAHNRALGEKIARLLKLRMLMRQFTAQAAEDDPEKWEEFKESRKDYEDFSRDQKVQNEVDKKSDWDLSADEEKELKKFYRKAARDCHPDRVPPEHVDAASAMFIQLQDAYEAGDLETVRKITRQVEMGIFEPNNIEGRSEEEQKENLRERIAAMRETLDKARSDLEAVKVSATYETISETEDWDGYFAERGALLDDEIVNLEDELETVGVTEEDERPG